MPHNQGSPDRYVHDDDGGGGGGGEHVVVDNFPTDYPDVAAQASLVAILARLEENFTVEQGTNPWLIEGPVTQGTSPWVVSGAVTVSNFPADYPDAAALTALLAIEALLDDPLTVNQGTSPWVVGGAVADGAPVSGNPVRIAGKDPNGDTQDVRADTTGNLGTYPKSVQGATADNLTDNQFTHTNETGQAVYNRVQQWIWDPSASNWDRERQSTTPADTQPISAAALPLPAGAATLAEQQAQTAALQIIDDWDESDRAKVNPIVGQAGIQGGAGTVSANTTRVAIATDANVVDTELPAAAALSDAFANPTAPAVGAFGMVWDGSQWVRMFGTAAGGLAVDPLAATGGTADNDADSAQIPSDTTGQLRYVVRPQMFDGTNWDRLRGTSADGLLVNLGTNNDITATDLDIRDLNRATDDVATVPVNGVIQDNSGDDCTFKVYNALVAADVSAAIANVVNKKIRVLQLGVNGLDANTELVTFEDNDTGTDRWQCIAKNNASGGGGMDMVVAHPGGFLFETASGKGISIVLANDRDCWINIGYIEVD